MLFKDLGIRGLKNLYVLAKGQDTQEPMYKNYKVKESAVPSTASLKIYSN